MNNVGSAACKNSDYLMKITRIFSTIVGLNSVNAQNMSTPETNMTAGSSMANLTMGGNMTGAGNMTNALTSMMTNSS